MRTPSLRRTHGCMAATIMICLLAVLTSTSCRLRHPPGKSQLPSAWHHEITTIRHGEEVVGEFDHAYRFVRYTGGSQSDSLIEWEWRGRLRNTHPTHAIDGWLVYALSGRGGRAVASDSLFIRALLPGRVQDVRRSAWMDPDATTGIHHGTWRVHGGSYFESLNP